jgi:hypothetical protein
VLVDAQGRERLLYDAQITATDVQRGVGSL